MPVIFSKFKVPWVWGKNSTHKYAINTFKNAKNIHIFTFYSIPKFPSNVDKMAAWYAERLFPTVQYKWQVCMEACNYKLFKLYELKIVHTKKKLQEHFQTFTVEQTLAQNRQFSSSVFRGNRCTGTIHHTNCDANEILPSGRADAAEF